MNLPERAKKHISSSTPYFQILVRDTISKNLKLALIREAPLEFWDTLTQISRHFINGNLCSSNKKFCAKFQKSILLFADLNTTISDKRLILELEPTILIKELFELFSNRLKNDSS